MTSKTSLFNSGIYTNILRRFKWGGFLYLIILFFSTPFVLLVQNPQELADRSQRYYELLNSGIILRESYMVIPYLLALIVPTITAILIFGHVHSAKQGIFTHALPVTRKANYVSSLLGGFTLMLAPILINGIILALMSICGYSESISLWSVILWIAIQASVIFIMFSVAVLSGFLTGHNVAHAAINAVIHLFPLLIALAIVLVSDIFLYGFVQSENFIAERIMTNTPLVWLFTRLTINNSMGVVIFKSAQFWVYVIGAAAVYALGYVLYTKRKIEACGEVAAFKIFRPILKYTLTVAAAICSLGILWATELGAVATFTVGAVISALVYFACEMLLSKTVKVFGRYKGYAVFAACMAVVIAFCAFTSIFGYETRIPDKKDIAKASVFAGYYKSDEAPLIADAGAIDSILEFHEGILEYIPLTERSYRYLNSPYISHIYVKYELKNGKVIDRYYPVTQELSDKMLSRMYEFPDYKMRVTGIDMLNVENAHNVQLGMYASTYNYNIALNEDSAELMKAIKRDIEQLSYLELERDSNPVSFHISLSLSKEENDKHAVFDESLYSENADPYEVQSFSINVNSNFKNAMEFLKSKGYYDTMMNGLAQSLWICTEPFFKEGDLCTFKDDTGEFGEFYANPADCVQPEADDALSLAELIINSEYTDIPEGKSYFVFTRSRDMGGNLWFANKAICLAEKDLPEFLKAYVE